MPSRSPSNSPFARGRTALQARRLLSAFLPLQGGGQVGVCGGPSCTFGRTGARHPGIKCSSTSPALALGPSRGNRGAISAPSKPRRGGRRGAPPGNEQGYGMERYRPPRRTGSSAGHPHGGPWSRVFVTGAAQTGLPCFSHGKSIRGGLTPGLPDEAGSRPAFAGSPWPDLPRCGPDRCSGLHPPVPALPTRTVPDPAPGRADDHHRMRGCAPDSMRL